MSTFDCEAQVLHSEKHAHGEATLIKIYEDLASDEEEKSNSCRVRVCRVPISFASAMSEAFTPQFVGLGPYHHFNPNLPMTDELKLGVVKRVLRERVQDIRSSYQSLHNQNVVSEVEAFYHNPCDSRTLLPVLTVDALFFLALLHSLTQFRYSSNYFILTGKPYPMLPVNAAGVELSMDGIIRDLFMFENQIPTFFIKHINTVNNNIIDLRSFMLNFCETHSPLVVSSAKLSKALEAHHHLLDLMYYLIAPEPQPNNPHEQLHGSDYICSVLFVPTILVYIFCSFLWIALWILVYVVVVTLQPFLQFIRFILVKAIPWSSAILHQRKIEFPTLRDFIDTVRDLLLYYVLTNNTVLAFPLRNFHKLVSVYVSRAPSTVPAAARRRSPLLDPPRGSMDYSSYATIPSAAELYHFRVQFKAVESDVSSIKFDEAKRELYLPCIKLDATSEIILRNLAAYESSIENNRLHFSSYVQLMRALVQTHEDVKILMDKKIIHTQLSAEAVIQIFNMPMGESSGRLTKEIEKLQVRLRKVKPKLEAINNLYFILTEFLRICTVCIVVVVFLPLLAQAFERIWGSTIFGNSFQSLCTCNQVGDRSREDDHYNMSSDQ